MTKLPIFALIFLTLPLMAASPCDSEERSAAYADYYNLRAKKNASGAPDVASQKQAYDLAKAYLEKYGAACADQYTDAVRKFVTAYEEASERFHLTRAAFGATPDPATAFAIGRRILEKSPDDVHALMAMTHAGHAAVADKNESFVDDALASGKQAIDLIEVGKAPASWDPFKSREAALSYLSFYMGELSFTKRDLANAIAWLVKAGTLEGPAKKEPTTYSRLAAAYHMGQLTAMQQEYNAKYAGKPETPEGKHALNEILYVYDRIIDAYARAVHLAGDDPKYAPFKKPWMDALQNFYKRRVNEDMTGFDSYIAAAMDRPLLAPYERKPYTPAPAAPSKK